MEHAMEFNDISKILNIFITVGALSKEIVNFIVAATITTKHVTNYNFLQINLLSNKKHCVQSQTHLIPSSPFLLTQKRITYFFTVFDICLKLVTKRIYLKER